MDFVGSNNPLRRGQQGEKSSSNTSKSMMMASEQHQQEEQQEWAKHHHRRSQERRMKRLTNCLNPCEVFYRLLFVLSHSTLVISIPCFIVAWILYHYLGDPSLDFMPGNATLSWWLDSQWQPLLAQREVGSSRSLSTGVIKIKNLLDRWEEPVNKLDKSTKSSVHDILKFRKALTYMDLEHPFREAFGLASTRDELIKSAQTLFQQLLKLSPGLQCLPYSVLAVLSQNLDGSVDIVMKKTIRNRFRADAQGEISMLSFVQTCDVVYRRLRYFRASVGNSSVFDKVLENIINGFFAIGLTIVILSLLHFDPWPLLVSVSTLLVSLAFAIGPTAAKAIEGIILIAGLRYVTLPILQSRKETISLKVLKSFCLDACSFERPFDIGDRIIIADSPGQPTAGMNDSWFVEGIFPHRFVVHAALAKFSHLTLCFGFIDITLFSTTLRLASNNEVAMVSNGAISGTRITNCARSKNAVVNHYEAPFQPP